MNVERNKDGMQLSLQDIRSKNPSLVICKTSSKTLGTINIREMLIVASNWQCNL